jgi:hypothetical protein
MKASMAQVLRAFRELGTHRVDQQAAALESFSRRYGLLVLCEHGSRPWLVGCDEDCKPLVGVGDVSDGGETAWPAFELDVSMCMLWANGLDACVQAFEMTHQGKALFTPQVLALVNLLGLPLASAPATPWRDLLESKQPRIEDQKRLLATWLRTISSSTSTYVGVEWEPRRRPEMLIIGRDLLDALILQVALGVGMDTDATYTCSLCNLPFTPARPPRQGEGLYCQQEACQRERRRRNKQAQRQAKAAKS